MKMNYPIKAKWVRGGEEEYPGRQNSRVRA